MLIIDRIEGDFAVIECGDVTFNIPLSELPTGSKEGDCLMLCLAPKQTDVRKKQMEALLNKLTEN